MKNIDYLKLGERIRNYRHNRSLSQEDLAEAAELTNVHISNIENGNKNPSIDVIVSIAAALKVTPDQLLADSLPEKPQYKDDIDRIFQDCSSEEISILIENCEGLKRVLSKYQIKE